jgi:hypothetical protein
MSARILSVIFVGNIFRFDKYVTSYARGKRRNEYREVGQNNGKTKKLSFFFFFFFLSPLFITICLQAETMSNIFVM